MSSDAKGPVKVAAASNGDPKGSGKKPKNWKDIVKDENIAKAVGAIIFGGIAYNIYRSSSKNKPVAETVSVSGTSSNVKSAADSLSSRKDAPVDVSTGLRQHQVATGDTLFSLAKTYKVPLDELRGSNLIEDDRIWVGQVLNIPS